MGLAGSMCGTLTHSSLWAPGSALSHLLCPMASFSPVKEPLQCPGLSPGRGSPCWSSECLLEGEGALQGHSGAC